MAFRGRGRQFQLGRLDFVVPPAEQVTTVNNNTGKDFQFRPVPSEPNPGASAHSAQKDNGCGDGPSREPCATRPIQPDDVFSNSSTFVQARPTAGPSVSGRPSGNGQEPGTQQHSSVNPVNVRRAQPTPIQRAINRKAQLPQFPPEQSHQKLDFAEQPFQTSDDDDDAEPSVPFEASQAISEKSVLVTEKNAYEQHSTFDKTSGNANQTRRKVPSSRPVFPIIESEMSEALSNDELADLMQTASLDKARKLDRPAIVRNRQPAPTGPPKQVPRQPEGPAVSDKRTETLKLGAETEANNPRESGGKRLTGEPSFQFGRPSDFGPESASFGGSSSHLGRRPFVFGQSPSVQTPHLEQANAVLGETRVVFGEQPDQFGEQSAPFGQNPSNFPEQNSSDIEDGEEEPRPQMPSSRREEPAVFSSGANRIPLGPRGGVGRPQSTNQAGECFIFSIHDHSSQCGKTPNSSNSLLQQLRRRRLRRSR